MIPGLLKDIGEDNRSGAAELLHRAAEAFSALEDSLPGGESLDLHKAREVVINTCVLLIRAQPEMAPLANLATAVARAVRAAESAGDVLARAPIAARRFAQSAQERALRATAHAARLIGEGAVVFTHSRSSTVLEAFRQARREGRSFSVIATESRPMLEGRDLAAALAREGISVTLAADAAAAAMIEQADCVLLGADRVTPSSVINKIGSRLIALAAASRRCPLYAACDTTKFISADLRRKEAGEAERGRDLWPDAPPGVRLWNRYFEPVSIACFDRIVTEDGPIVSDDAIARAQSITLDELLTDALYE